jgi:oxygen-dependent protoporphyrinogen oxidase
VLSSKPVGHTPSPHLPIAILGAGLTGLSAARHLARAGRHVVIFDAAPSVGGVIRSERHPDGWLAEAGPNSLQETPAVASLIRELGLDSRRRVAAPEAKNRYIFRQGALRPLPVSPPAFLKSGVFSPRTKLRVAREYFRSRYPEREADLPLADFFREHFGAELLDYALDPFVSGIYAGDPAQLSARHAFPSLWRAEQEHGSLIKAQILAARAKKQRGEPTGPPPVISFDDGLAVLPRALAAALPPESIRLSAPVARLQIIPGEGWKLDASPGERFSHVIVALPAPAVACLDIGPPGLTTSLSSLTGIKHPPVTSIFLGYRRTDIAHPLDGFGALMPSVEKRDVLGVLFNSTLFPGRAPAGHVALTVLIGGMRRPELARLPLEAQLVIAQRELASILGARGDPVFVRRAHWTHAIPQYQIGHDSHRDVMAAAEQRNPGLHIGGPLRDGIGLPACLAAGERLARAALA